MFKLIFQRRVGYFLLQIIQDSRIKSQAKQLPLLFSCCNMLVPKLFTLLLDQSIIANYCSSTSPCTVEYFGNGIPLVEFGVLCFAFC